MRQQKDNAELLGDVFVFGRMPFEGGRRQVGIDAQGPVFGPREHKGSLATWDKPVTGSGRAVKKPKKSGKKRY